MQRIFFSPSLLINRNFCDTIFREKKKNINISSTVRSPWCVADVRIGRAKLGAEINETWNRKTCKNFCGCVLSHRANTILWNFPNYLRRIARNDCKLRDGSPPTTFCSFILFSLPFYVRP